MGSQGIFTKPIGKSSIKTLLILCKLFSEMVISSKSSTSPIKALIPKVDNPFKVNQFKPISLTNFNYKIISKILANRLKLHMDKIVSPNQFAFIKGRLIHDNSILMHEIFHTIKHKQGNGGLMAIKLDMEKAFDHMDWVSSLKFFWPLALVLIESIS